MLLWIKKESRLLLYNSRVVNKSIIISSMIYDKMANSILHIIIFYNTMISMTNIFTRVWAFYFFQYKYDLSKIAESNRIIVYNY